MTAFFGFYIQYRDLGRTDTPRDSSMLARVFAFCGLDMVFCWSFGGVTQWNFSVSELETGYEGHLNLWGGWR
jgi:hypothetical protein